MDPLEVYRRLTPASRKLWERAATRVPGGVTANVKYFAPYPVYMRRASGSNIMDADGREYIDYCLAFGPIVAGHGHPQVMEAIHRELDRAGTTILGGPSELELQLAERLAALIPSAEMVRFANSGTEATMHALRIARGVTGRSRIIKFEGHYHGGHDAVLINIDCPLPVVPANDGIPAATRDGTIVLPFNDLPALEAAFESEDDVAAVILEPVARGVIAAEPQFLERLRELTWQKGVVLIFDEIITWPRLGPGGAQQVLGVTPDLTALGKAIGGGLPAAAVVGRRDIMEAVVPPAARTVAQDFSPADGPYVFHSGTYNGTPAALAAGLAVLDLLEAPGTYDRWFATADALRQGLSRVFGTRGVAVQVLRSGSMVNFYFTPDAIRSARDIWRSDLGRRHDLDYRLLACSIYNVPGYRMHLSLAHSADDIERTIAAFEKCTTSVEAASASP